MNGWMNEHVKFSLTLFFCPSWLASRQTAWLTNSENSTQTSIWKLVRMSPLFGLYLNLITVISFLKRFGYLQRF